MSRMRNRLAKQTGLSLVELMIALTIGLLLLSGLTLIFVNSSEANRELQKTAQQIENGRYASDILTQDLHHAGFYGRLHVFTEPAAVPDPCETADTALLEAALSRPVQGYRAANLATRADISATTCDDKGLLTNANLQPGSDVLVVRRASTKALAGNSTAEEVYVQASGSVGKVRIGDGNAFAAIGVLNKDGSQAPIRKLVVHVYFVAPCSVGSGANGVCQAGDDGVPTLKRLELKVDTDGVRKMVLTPLVEGIEYLKAEYGIDNVRHAPCDVVKPDGTCSVTGLTGDSMVDSYTPTPGNWTEVVAAKAYVLASNTLPTSGFTDDKSYVLGSVTVAPADYAGRERYRRHAYASEVRLINLAGRREIP